MNFDTNIFDCVISSAHAKTAPIRRLYSRGIARGWRERVTMRQTGRFESACCRRNRKHDGTPEKRGRDLFTLRGSGQCCENSFIIMRLLVSKAVATCMHSFRRSILTSGSLDSIFSAKRIETTSQFSQSTSWIRKLLLFCIAINFPHFEELDSR